MKNISVMLGGVFIATLAFWGPGITLASAVVVAGVEIDRTAVLQELKNDPELQAEVGDLMGRLGAGGEGAKAEVEGVVEQIQQEVAAPAEREGAPVGGEGVTTEAVEAPEAVTEAPAVEAPEAPQSEIPSSAADAVAEENTDKTITWCDGTVHPSDELDPGCP